MPRVTLRPNFGPPAAPLEDTFSPEEVAQHFGCTVWQVHELIRKGRKKPYAGGLAGTFKPSHRMRRIPRSSIERHKAWMANPKAAAQMSPEVRRARLAELRAQVRALEAMEAEEETAA